MKTKYLIPLALFSIILAGCDKPIQENCGCLPGTTAHREFYRLTVNSVSEDICPDAPKQGQHAGLELIKFKILCVTDVTFYAFLDNERLTPVQEANRLGYYSYYEFLMPEHDATLTITSERYFVDKDYSLSEVSPVGVSPSQVNKIKLEQGYIGVDPETANPTVTYSVDREDIEYNADITTGPYLVKSDDPMPQGGSYVTVTFYYNSGAESSITIENDMYIIRSFSGLQLFKFKKDAPRFEIKHPMTGDNR